MSSALRTTFGALRALLAVGSTSLYLACSASADITPPPEEGPGGGAAGFGASSAGGVLQGGDGGTSGDAGAGGQGVTFIPPSTGGIPSGGAPGTGASSGASGNSACNPAPDTPVPEVCGNGLDDDLNGFVDENCICTGSVSQPCFNGPPSQANAPNCHKGTQTCSGASEFPAWRACEGSGCD